MPDSYSRRHFLKLSAALLAGGAAIAAAPDARGMGFSGVPDVGPVTEMKGYCPFCQVRCTYRARVSGGKVLSLTGEKDNYWTGGAMCPKGMSIVELIGSPYRGARKTASGSASPTRRPWTWSRNAWPRSSKNTARPPPTASA